MIRAIAVLAPLLIAAPAAAVTTYECEFAREPSGWVSGDVVASIQTDGSGRANSGVAQHFAGGAVPAAVAVDNARRTTIRYEVRGTKDRGRQYSAKLVYRLTVQKADGSARISMTPVGYGNSFQNGGRCEVRRR